MATEPWTIANLHDSAECPLQKFDLTTLDFSFFYFKMSEIDQVTVTLDSRFMRL